MPDLIDASVWLPLNVESHVHHERARRYWNSEASEKVAFCRVTALALLRHLSTQQVIGDAALDGAGAWQAVKAWRAIPHVAFLEEPNGLDELLSRWAITLDIRGRHWTDAYLAAFATASGCRLVSFDSDFSRYPGLAWLHLEAN